MLLWTQSDVTALKPGKKSENGFHMPTLSGSLSHSKPHPACSKYHHRKLPHRQTGRQKMSVGASKVFYIIRAC